ncbi:MAG: LamG-like jellyroll fold domain-containing protein [Bacteroidia bacterium]
MKNLYLAIIILLQFEFTSNAQVSYVTITGNGLQNGTTWGNAYNGTQLQTAINQSGISEVWVATGTYKPTSGTDRTISFVMKNGVAIYGGFNGTETLLSQRNWATNITTLSGDIGILNDSTDNTYHVINNSNLNTTATVDGFTIRDGFSYVNSGNGYGGGMANQSSSPTISNCTFLNNVAFSSDFFGLGGGMYNSASNPVIFNCIFQNNLAKTKDPIFNCGCTLDGLGGAIYNTGSNPQIINCIFTSNKAIGDAANAYGIGGAIYSESGNTVAINCIFSGNTTSSLGSYGNNGGAIFIDFNAISNITNCTFSGNSGYEGGAIANSGNSTIKNCIIWGNNANIQAGIGGFGTANVTNSIVQGGFTGAGNQNVNPLFVSTADLHLTLLSPAVNAGSNAAVPIGITTDLDGNPRIYNNATVDMGPYEFQGQVTQPPTISGATSFCAGSSTTLDAGNGYGFYNWSTGASTQTILVNTSGTYTVTVTNNPGGTASAAVTVNVNSLPQPVINSSGPTTFCQSTNIYLSTGTYSNYQWSNGNISQTNLVSSSGNYIVTVTDANGCTGTNSVLVHTSSYPPLQTINPGSSTNLCPGTSVTITSSANEKGLQLDGSTQYAITPSLTSFFSSPSFTAELWFNANAAGVIMSELGQPVINSGWHDSQIEILANGHVMGRVWDLSAIDMGTVSFGTWHHVAIRYNATTNTLDGFLDGVQSGNSTGVRQVPAALYLAFGATDATHLGSGAYFNGQLDEIRIWNTALSSAQIIEFQNSSTDVNFSNLVAYYKLNDLPGTGGADASGHGNSLSLVNNPAWITYQNSPLLGNFLWSNGSTTASINISTAGTYYVTLTNDAGCSTGSNIVSVTQIPDVVHPAITVDGSTSICSGKSVTLASGIAAGNCVHFDGTGDISMPYTSVFNLGSHCSIEAWIKTTYSGEQYISSKEFTYHLAVNGGNAGAGKITFYLQGVYNNWLVSGSRVDDGVWHHIACTFDQFNVRIYIDGVLDATGAATGSLVTSSNPDAYIGSRGGNNKFHGDIDELRIWRLARTQAEIINGMYGSVPYNSTLLQTYFKFDEGTGNTTTGYGQLNPLTATLNNASWVTPSTLLMNYSSYLWSNGATTASISVSNSGTYTVAIPGNSGCSATSVPVSISVLPSPTPTINASGPTTICTGASINLATGIYNGYLWSGGETTSNISAGIGSYTVTVTDNNGCSGGASQTISLTPASANLSTTNITQTTAIAHWASAGTGLTYFFEKRPVGSVAFDPGWTTSDTKRQMKNMTTNVQYEWHVRTICASGQYSDWSSLQQFTTMGIICTNTPTGLSATNLTTSSAKFHWNVLSPSPDKYQLRYRIVGTTSWITKTGVGTAIQRLITGLSSGSNYEWQIRGRCGTVAPYDFSNWSSLSTFSLPALRMSSDENELEVNVFPNPTTGIISVSIPGCDNCTYKLTMCDVVGNIVYDQSVAGSEQLITLDFSNLTKGIYVLNVNDGNVRRIAKVVLQ